MNRRMTLRLCGVGLICLALGAFAVAQVKTETETVAGTPTQKVVVEQGEVVYVSGNHLMVKMANGEIRDFPNVPDTARAVVDGKEIGIRDVKVGMKLQRTITTTTTPTVVTTVQSVKGTVFAVNPPSMVILTLENGKNQKFTIPSGQKIEVDGRMLDAFDLRPGMKVTATKVVTVPESVVAKRAAVTGTAPPPPPPPPQASILIEEEVSTPAPAPKAAAPAPATLPKTASLVPLLGLAGMLSLGLGLGLGAIRRRS
jgi:hypothetical protein